MIDFKILVVDDEEEYTDAYSLILSNIGYTVLVSSSGEECLKILEAVNVDAVITDIKMAGMDGLELLQKIKESYDLCEVIMVTGYGSIKSAIQAMKQGAFGYFIKGESPDLLLLEIEKLVKMKKLKEMALKIKTSPCAEYMIHTKNKSFSNLLHIAQKASQSDSNILILGESGTGKEVLAKFIHHESQRAGNPFIPVNCQMFSDGVLESELFGHEKGAFTGAIERRIGRFEEADSGTLFLDEVGEIPLSTQAKLLRALENRSFERLGSNKPIHVNIRIISATNRILEDAIKSGIFREDLLYRINTITLHIPPLRERKEDLDAFIGFFVAKFQMEMKKEINGLEDGLSEILINYDYPGNIRELRNIIERLVVLSDDKTLHKKHLPDSMRETSSINTPIATVKSLKEIREEAEAAYITSILKDCGGNVSKTAKLLDLSRRQLFNKISDYGIKNQYSNK